MLAGGKLGFDSGNFYTRAFILAQCFAVVGFYPLGKLTGIPPNNPADHETYQQTNATTYGQGYAPVDQVGFKGWRNIR
ncbi:MAG: hypothetical protein CMO55_08245 [Verrucomicrobiales bacterium]|nr:hypothetical protein [Verrucomicrobiales bacterium]